MTWVIAICGTMGSGKSTLAENAAAAIPDCSVVFEDDHNRMTERSLDNIEDWFSRGGDVSEFELSDVIERLTELCPDKRSTTSVESSPDSRASAHQIVLLETHFGRLHSALSPWIDFQVWINTPADIAVARKVLQLSQQMTQQNPPVPDSNGLRWIEKFCSGYLTTTRKLFNLQRQQVGAVSDVTIDGEGSPWDVCGRFLENLPTQFRPED
jgi:uridine kinase